MRGYPLLNLLVTLLFSGAILWPLVHRATSVSAVSAVPDSPGPASMSGASRSRLSLRMVRAAKSVRLLDGDKLLHQWTPGPDELQLEESLNLPLNDQRMEFTVQIEWPDGAGETVAELRVEPDGLPVRLTNLWSSGSRLDEVVTLTWKGDSL